MMSHAKRERRMQLGVKLSLLALVVVPSVAAIYLFAVH